MNNAPPPEEKTGFKTTSEGGCLYLLARSLHFIRSLPVTCRDVTSGELVDPQSMAESLCLKGGNILRLFTLTTALKYISDKVGEFASCLRDIIVVPVQWEVCLVRHGGTHETLPGKGPKNLPLTFTPD